ncbi:MAG: hypothetical protein KKB90_05375, partial [Actinobacteria bacterium]|nr:hypothetical protein [Actinomycetota bacterium]MBU4359821.1 hypothetical protein [Actinomycetota bacterium]
AKATEPNVSAQDAYNSIKDSTLTTEGYLVFQTSTSYPGDEPYYLNYKGGEKKPPDVGEEEAVRRAAKEYAKGMSRVMWNPEVGFHNAKIIGEWASVTVVAPEGYAECGYHIICKKEGGEWRGVAWGYFRDDLEERAPGCPEELLQLGRGPRDGD